jgi:hypothetical protein
MQHVRKHYLKVFCFYMSIGLLNFVTETQQQGNITHTATTLSQARCCLASTSSGELVFFGVTM